MKWAIDKIEANIAMLENIDTGEKKEVATSLLPSSIHEGSILIFKENTYSLSPSLEEERRQEVLLKFQKLRSKD